MKAERIESSLHPRIWSFNRQGVPQRQLALLTDGAGEVEAGAERFSAEGPAFILVGSLRPGRLRTEAGTTGYRGAVTDATILSALGDEPESRDLRLLAERSFVLSLAGQGEKARILERCFEGVLRETQHPQEGSRLIISALVRIMLVTMLRLTGGAGLAISGMGKRAGILQRFRQLVELNFRDHWSVARYAAALGISADRLHAICSDGVGKSPKALISERVLHEAMSRLELSPLTVEQFAHTLGFNDPAHFSVFFKRMTGTTPGRYRNEMAALRAAGQAAPQPSFAEWP